jgi:hypothetical protein
MSQFGDGTLRQNILFEVECAKSEHGASNIEIIAALAEIIQYFAEEL